MGQTFDEILDSAQEHHIAGRPVEAIGLYQDALKLRPDDDQCLFFLGLALFQSGQAAEAADRIWQAIASDPNVAEYHCDLGRILFHLNDLGGAIAAGRRALELRTDFPEAWFNLGNALCRSELFDEGIEAYRRAIALRGDVPDALNNLGMALLSVGLIDEAIACFERIVASHPNDAAADSNRIYALHFHPDWDAAAIRRELCRWNERHARPLKRVPPRIESGELARPLRIGYVSPDFREHVVGWNLPPLLREHDTNRFHVFCYSAVRRPDAITRELQSHTFRWCNIADMSDDAAAEMIRQDQIDILVDLSLHTGGNRLLIFARKPAPIQATYLGYPGSTGLEAMDYRISDPFLDSDAELADHTEQTIRLSGSYWCYRPGGPTPDVVPPPVLSMGTITFGCLNAFQKLWGGALELWARIMQAVPGSRLLLHSPKGNCRERILSLFATWGVGRDRIEFVGRVPWAQYIRTYQRIDIALDPFPYGGGITSCDALWMGVPVVTLRGNTSVGRAGASILNSVGLTQLVGQSRMEYFAAAVVLATDTKQLTEIRSTLRAHMAGSHLMDAVHFAREIERAFLHIWERSASSSIKNGTSK